MRTTITISDATYREVKATAARDGRTVGALVEDALRSFLQAKAVEPAELAPLPVFQGPRGLMPGVDLEDNASLLELMDEGLPLDALR